MNATDETKAEAVRDYFRVDRSRMTMMAARKFGVPERMVVDALVGQWPIVRLRGQRFQSVWSRRTVRVWAFAVAGAGPNECGLVNTSGCRISSSCSRVKSFLARTRS